MFSSKIKIILFLLLSSLFGIYPHQYNLDENLNTYDEFNIRTELDGWPSRSIVDLRLNYNNEIFVGTGGGLGKIIFSNNGEIANYSRLSTKLGALTLLSNSFARDPRSRIATRGVISNVFFIISVIF